MADPNPISLRNGEAARILHLVGGDTLRAFELVERQLTTLVLRAQVMLSLCGIVVTVTGFSGRSIAQTSNLARLSIAAGILIVLASAAVAMWGVLRLRWFTQELDDEPLVTLRRGLAIRDRKAAWLARALALFIVGFGCYCFAIAQLLLAASP